MTIKLSKLIFAFLIALLPLTMAAAQQKSETREPDYAQTRDFKARVFELKYRDPQEVYVTIRVLGSGFKGAEVTYNSANKTIAVRDFPENLATIEEALKRLDVPSTKSEPTVELTMHVFLTNTGQPSDQVPSDIKDVLKQLQNTLAFKDYQLVTSIVQRAKARGRQTQGTNGRGSAVWKQFKVEGAESPTEGSASYEYQIGSMDVVINFSGATTIQLNNFRFVIGTSSVQSDLELRDGEKVVVGTAGFGNKSMILVLTAKITK
ncbi:MAG: hypothetical protein M3X11_18885 [Acidobacteriota bacterium]|nr:hypothetical protein [Acidobacteriota bacterium]